jgi:thymidylate synthase (FAD)
VKIELINSMGDDLTVVNAARVSFDKESEWESITPAGPIEHLLTEKDTKLIKYLAKHNHFTPFTHCTITISRRYVDDTPKIYTPDAWRAKANNAKQGSSEETIDINPVGERPPPMVDIYKLSIKNSLWTYEELLRKGVCPEQARMVLPQSMYTSYYVTGSLYAWARAYNLRSDPHAQKEIQEIASQWNEICTTLYPTSWKALTND